MAAQVDGQVIPAPVTVPPPDTETVKSTPVELTQAALTDRSPVSSTVQATFVPLHAPPQPVKTLSGAGACRTVSVDPVSTVRTQVAPAGDDPQSMSPPLTLPLPVNVVESVLVVTGGPAKFAVTVCSPPSTAISHVSPTAAVGQPAQLSKLQSVAGLAVSVTAAPLPENAM